MSNFADAYYEELREHYTHMKDLFVGDSIAGLLRTIESCIIAVAIAAGYFTIALIMGGAIV